MPITIIARLFLNQACAATQCAPGFLKSFLCGHQYVCVRPDAPQAIKNYSREMKSE